MFPQRIKCPCPIRGDTLNELMHQITYARLMKVIKIGGERTHRPFSILCDEQDEKFKTWDIDIAMDVRVGDYVLVKQGTIIKIVRC